MKSQAEITRLLRDAARQFGRERIKAMLPPRTAIWISDHDTGCQIWIRLAEDPEHATLADLCAWQGSIWYSSAYEFNDRGKLLGFNPETDFAMRPLEDFFSQVESAFVNAGVNAIANREEQHEQARREHAAKLSHFRELFQAGAQGAAE